MTHTLRTLLALPLLAVSLPAAVIFNNGTSDLITGDNMSEVQVAEDFSLGATYNVTAIRFWSIQELAANYRGSVYWAIHNNSGANPGSILQSGIAAAVLAVPTGNSAIIGYAEYQFDIPVAFQLTAGNYWLALHNGPLSDGSPAEMLWATTTPGSGATGQYATVPGIPTWIDTLQEHAFQLDGRLAVGAVPEPGSLLLLGSGLALGLLRLKRR